jgi:hypothetical protein
MRERPQDRWYEPDIRAELRKYKEQHLAKAWKPVVRWGILVFTISVLTGGSLIREGFNDGFDHPVYEKIISVSFFGFLWLRFGYCVWRLYKMKRFVKSMERRLDLQTTDSTG